MRQAGCYLLVALKCSSWWDLHFLTSSGIQLKTQKSSVWESVGLSKQSRMLSDQRFSNLLSKWKRLNEIKNNTGLGDQLLWHDGRCCARELGIQNSKKSQPTNVHNLTCLNHQSRWSATLTRWRMLCERFLSTSSPSRHTSSAPSHRRRRRVCLRLIFTEFLAVRDSFLIQCQVFKQFLAVRDNFLLKYQEASSSKPFLGSMYNEVIQS